MMVRSRTKQLQPVHPPNAGTPVTDLSDNDVPSENDPTVTSLTQSPSFTVDKATSSTPTVVGDTLNYTFTVINTGNVPLTTVLVTDIKCESTIVLDSESITEDTVLEIAETQVYSCTSIAITQAEVDVAKVDNTVTVTAVSPMGVVMPATDTLSTAISVVASIALEKVDTLDMGTDNIVTTGDVINYAFKVTNTSNITLTNIIVTDPKVTVVGGPIATMAPGAEDTGSFTATYTITQTDIDLGYFENIADVTAKDPTDNDVTDKSDDPKDLTNDDTTGNGNADDVTHTPLPQAPDLMIVKATPNNADEDTSNTITLGDTLTYTITATNSGNQTLTNVVVSDPLITPNSKTCASLAVNDACILTGDYVVSQTDTTTGQRDNTATVNSDQTSIKEASVTVPVVVMLPPVAVDDEKHNQPLAQPVMVNTVGNDSDADNALDFTSVKLVDGSGNPVTTFIVAKEGTWTVDTTTGAITFTPDTGFLGNPTPVEYTIKDVTGLVSNKATVTITYEAPAALTGTVWLDRDKDGQIDANEDRKVGWTLKVIDKDGNIVATTTTNNQGEYSVTGLIPAEYTVEFYNPNGVYVASATTDGPLQPNTTVDLPLPVDPSGVVYDSKTREPLSNVKMQLVNSAGTPVADVCLGAQQQNQVTLADGLYKFDITPNADATCPNGETYSIRVTPPTGYTAKSTIIPAQTGVYDGSDSETNCTIDSIPNSGSCEVQGQPDAPTGTEDTSYFMRFLLSSGDRNIIFNHIPLDAIIAARPEDSLVLTKSVNKKQVSIGDQLYYTIIADNTAAGNSAINIDIMDNLPTGFKFTGSTAKLIKSGATGDRAKFDTGDYAAATTVTADGAGKDPVIFGVITVPAGEKIQIGYLLKVGTGVRQGEAINTAQAMLTGTRSPVSNIANASAVVIAESVLNDSALIGKVFHDRDSDGYQDSAEVTGLTVRSGKWAKNLGNIKGRISVLDNPSKHSRTVRVPDSGASQIKVTTKEGSVIYIDTKGNLSESHTGMKAKGLSSQDIRVTSRRTGNATNVTITNHGIDEEGIPGVRLATVKGLLIETDGYGRYHIPDTDAGRRGMGKNFILKVDKSTLPEGARFTTENPRVLRLTGSALNKINFGVKLPVQAVPERQIKRSATYKTETRKHIKTHQVPVYQSVNVNLGSIFFDKDKFHIRADQRGIMDDIANKIQRYGSGHITIDAFTDARHNIRYNIKLAEKRANTVRGELHKRLGSKLMRNVKVEVDPNAYKQEVPHNDPRAIDYNKGNSSLR